MTGNKLKTLILGLASASTLTVGADVATFDPKVIDDQQVQVADEMVDVTQVGNTVEATLPWKDADSIKIKYDLGEASIEERLKDKRDKEVYFEASSTEMQYGLILNKAPTTSTFCFVVEDAELYDWFKQPPLTQEEIDEGAFRPENVVNSYAVYHKTLKNHVLGRENYATGKAFHRYRPQATDAEGNTLWGDSNYANGEICDTYEQSWLNKAKYPVKL